MENGGNIITVQTSINADLGKVWAYWTKPEHIIKWNSASADWHTPHAENDLRKGGSFSARLEAKDGSMGFDFKGVYDDVRENEYIGYTLNDGRKVNISFSSDGNTTRIIENFEAEKTNPHDVQQGGWQSILTSFKNYTEQH